MWGMARKPYPSDVTDEEWAFAAGYLALMREDAPQREHDLREVFNALRYMVRAGLHFVAFTCLMLSKIALLISQSA
jgi:transposase